MVFLPMAEADEPKKSDTASVSKDKYLKLLTDLENIKNRLARISAREVEWQKKGLQQDQDILLDANWLDLALKHISDRENRRNIFQGLESIQDIINKFFITYEVQKNNAKGGGVGPEFT